MISEGRSGVRMCLAVVNGARELAWVYTADATRIKRRRLASDCWPEKRPRPGFVVGAPQLTGRGQVALGALTLAGCSDLSVPDFFIGRVG